jgi:hypothetical protein
VSGRAGHALLRGLRLRSAAANTLRRPTHCGGQRTPRHTLSRRQRAATRCVALCAGRSPRTCCSTWRRREWLSWASLTCRRVVALHGGKLNAAADALGACVQLPHPARQPTRSHTQQAAAAVAAVARRGAVWWLLCRASRVISPLPLLPLFASAGCSGTQGVCEGQHAHSGC